MGDWNLSPSLLYSGLYVFSDSIWSNRICLFSAATVCALVFTLGSDYALDASAFFRILESRFWLCDGIHLPVYFNGLVFWVRNFLRSNLFLRSLIGGSSYSIGSNLKISVSVLALE